MEPAGGAEAGESITKGLHVSVGAGLESVPGGQKPGCVRTNASGKGKCRFNAVVGSTLNSECLQYSSRRFSGLTEEETRDINDYILNITLAKGSGEYCICKCTRNYLK